MIPTGTRLFLKMKAGSKKRQKTTKRYSKQQHFCFRYLFSSETSKMILTGTLLFLKCKAGSKKRQQTPKRYSKQQHFCFWYLFSSETSKMLPTGTLLFSKMKAGSKKRQMTHTGTFLFLTPIAHRNFRDNTHWNTSIFEKWKRVLRRDRNRENDILNSGLWRGFAKNYSNLNHKMIMYTHTDTNHVSQRFK